MTLRVARHGRGPLWAVITAAAVCLLAASIDALRAQTVGFGHAVDWIGTACSKDIDSFCAKVNLGGGRILKCLSRQARVSLTCKNAVTYLTVLLERRAAARAAVGRACEKDVREHCANAQPGDAGLVECFSRARETFRASCWQAIADAGYDLAPTAASAAGSNNSSPGDVVKSLQGVASSAAPISAAALRQLVVPGMIDRSRDSRINRPPLSEQLNQLPQFTMAVRFDFDSARIQPESFKAVGLAADALYHPYLQGDRFLIVAHTDAHGDRERNLKLSQQRADAIRDALINPFGIASSRIEAVGLGEEQLLNRADPEAAENSRVQLINIGK